MRAYAKALLILAIALATLLSFSSCDIVKDIVHKHTLTHTPAKDATCAESGNTEYWECSGCGKRFSDESASTEAGDVTIPPAHSGATEVRGEIAATEHTEGYTGDTYCLACGGIVSYGSPVDKLPHTHRTTRVEGVEPDCDENGNIEYWVCSGCDKKFADGEATTEVSNVVIPAAHKGGTELRGEIAPGEYDDGYSGDTYCLGCGEMTEKGHTTPHTVTAPTLRLTLGECDADSTEVIISLVNNPGISSLKFSVLYDGALMIESVDFADGFGAYVASPEPYINPQTVNWICPSEEFSRDGEFMRITFTLAEGQTAPVSSDIRIIADNSNIFDGDMKPVSFALTELNVTVGR